MNAGFKITHHAISTSSMKTLLLILSILLTAIPTYPWSFPVHIAIGEYLGMANPNDLTRPDQRRVYTHYVNDPADFAEFYAGLLNKNGNDVIHIITDMSQPMHCTAYDTWNKRVHKGVDHMIDDIKKEELGPIKIGDGTLKDSLHALYMKSYRIAEVMRAGKPFTREMARVQLCHAVYVIKIYIAIGVK